MRILPVLTLAALAVFLSGCSKPEDTTAAAGSSTTGASAATKNSDLLADDAVVGKYKVVFTPAAGKENDEAAKATKQMAEGVEIELMADHTFKETAVGVPVEGTWAMKGLSLSMNATKVGGKTVDDMKKSGAKQEQLDDMAKALFYTVSEGGDVLTPNENPGAAMGSEVFKKQK